MQLKKFSKAIKLLPESYQKLPVCELKILEHNNNIVLIHQHHHPIFFDGQQWNQFKAQNW